MTQGLGNSRFMLKTSRIPRKLCLGILDLRCPLDFTATKAKTRKKHPRTKPADSPAGKPAGKKLGNSRILCVIDGARRPKIGILDFILGNSRFALPFGLCGSGS